jgi:hypothetical protein
MSQRPEHRLDSEFAHFVNEYHKVMTENFAERFFGHRDIRFASQSIVTLQSPLEFPVDALFRHYRQSLRHSGSWVQFSRQPIKGDPDPLRPDVRGTTDAKTKGQQN